MGKKIQFTQNYHDLSTTQGFQFEFYCDRCQSGFRTSFKPFATGIASNILETAGGLFGGVLGRAASVGERVRSATWERAHDQAFEAAIEELKPEFIQCPRCSAWVCREKCWNTGKGLCKNCAPDLGVEMAAAQANRSVEVGWVIGLTHAYDFLTWTGTIIAIIVSNYLLVAAGQVLPAGTVYAIYVGLGTTGTVVSDIIFFGEPFNVEIIILIAVLLAGVTGLKLVTDDNVEKGAET